MKKKVYCCPNCGYGLLVAQYSDIDDEAPYYCVPCDWWYEAHEGEWKEV